MKLTAFSIAALVAATSVVQATPSFDSVACYPECKPLCTCIGEHFTRVVLGEGRYYLNIGLSRRVGAIVCTIIQVAIGIESVAVERARVEGC